MKITSGRNPLAVGVDYREEYPKVCYQSIQMKEAQPLPLDFTGQTGRCACFRNPLGTSDIPKAFLWGHFWMGEKGSQRISWGLIFHSSPMPARAMFRDARKQRTRRVQLHV